MATNWTPADLARIEAAIATGVTTVHFEDREVTYRSVAELLSARAAIQAELLANSRPSRQVRFATTKGFGC
jgi:hypothetical protein